MPVPGENPALDAETQMPTLMGISIAFGSVSTIIVLLRLYTRFHIIRSPGLDDYTIAFAQVRSFPPLVLPPYSPFKLHKEVRRMLY
jgi:hypothetical protein